MKWYEILLDLALAALIVGVVALAGHGYYVFFS